MSACVLPSAPRARTFLRGFSGIDSPESGDSRSRPAMVEGTVQRSVRRAANLTRYYISQSRDLLRPGLGAGRQRAAGGSLVAERYSRQVTRPASSGRRAPVIMTAERHRHDAVQRESCSHCGPTGQAARFTAEWNSRLYVLAGACTTNPSGTTEPERIPSISFICWIRDTPTPPRGNLHAIKEDWNECRDC